MEVLKLIWWKHNCKAGQYSSAKVHRTLVVKPDGSFELATLGVSLAPEIVEPAGFAKYSSLHLAGTMLEG